MMFYINGKYVNQEEASKIWEKQKQQRIKKMQEAIYSVSYSSVQNVAEISEKQFYKLLKTASNIININECLGIEKGHKMYRQLFNKDGIIVNSSTSSTPAMDTYYSELIFKYVTEYYKVSMCDTN